MSIGINLPVYPQLVRVPGYPVYYAPSLNSNFFFYDGMYWVYQGDNWYASSWYNGPWGLVAPAVVPLYILRVPVRYYRQPPVYFGGWRADAPPRWGDHGAVNGSSVAADGTGGTAVPYPAPAPLPSYQRQYAGDRYPPAEQQNVLRSQNYRYQPRDVVVREHYQQQGAQRAPAPAQRAAPEARGEKCQAAGTQTFQRGAQLQQGSAPRLTSAGTAGASAPGKRATMPGSQAPGRAEGRRTRSPRKQRQIQASSTTGRSMKRSDRPASRS